ncbi:uncharacterized protein [Nicotiana tomentosiformis]|uniref:uncharacterized protein n=1 Tax=Nicotiana tomentosiformis TaxID=4098 RepID=UPI00388CC952
MEEHVSEKIIVEEEKDSYNEALGVEDDENGDDDAPEFDKDVEEEKEEEVAEEEHVAAEEEITDEEDEEEDDEDDEQLEDGEDGLDSEIDAAVEGDRDALSIPVFVRAIDVSNYRFMTFLRKHSRSLAKISMRYMINVFHEFRDKRRIIKLMEKFNSGCFVGDKPVHFGLKEFSMMIGLNCSSKPSKEAMKKVMDDGQAFCDKVCQYSKKGVDAELLLKQLKSKRLYTVERFKITLVWLSIQSCIQGIT